MSSLLTNIGSIITAAFGWVTQAVTTITASGNELLLLSCVISFVGLGISLLKRLLSVRA